MVFSGAVLGVLITWLSTNYIVNKQEFGFINGTFTRQSVTLGGFLLFGFNSTLSLYIHKYKEDYARRDALIGFGLLLPFITCLLFAIPYLGFKEWVVSHYQEQDRIVVSKYYLWLPLYTFFFMLLNMFEQYLVARMKVAVFSFAREVLVRVINIALLLLFAAGYIDIPALVGGTVLMYAVPIVYFSFVVPRTKGFGLSFRFSVFDKAEKIEMAKYSWYHFLLLFSMNLMGNLDILTLPFYDHSGLNAVAIYVVAQLLISFLQIPQKAMLPATYTAVAQAFTEDRIDEARAIFRRASLNIIIATVGVAIIIACNLDNAVALLKNGYGQIVPVFLILMVGKVLDISTGMNDQVLSITNYYKFNFYLSLGLIAVLYGLIRLLVPQYGIFGAAWSTTITLIIFNLAKFLFVWKKLDMVPYSKGTLLVIVAAAPALAAGWFLPNFFGTERHIYVNTFLDAGVRSTVIAVIYFVMLLWLKPSEDMVQYLANVRKSKRLF